MKIFHKKKIHSYTGGLKKIGRRVTLFEQLRNLTACERSTCSLRVEEFGRDYKATMYAKRYRRQLLEKR